MGQGTESCDGYYVEYDPYDYAESNGYEFWTERSGARIRVSEMSDRHIRNTIKMCKQLAATSSFSCDVDKWEEWVDVLEGELCDRARFGRVVRDAKRNVVKKPLPRAEKKDTWSGKTQNLSPYKTKIKNKARGAKVSLICWCGTEYQARYADLKRGWGLSCCKSCAAIKRDYGRPDPICAKTKVSYKDLIK